MRLSHLLTGLALPIWTFEAIVRVETTLFLWYAPYEVDTIPRVCVELKVT